MTLGNLIDLLRMEIAPGVNIEEVIVIYNARFERRFLVLGGERSGQVLRHDELTTELEEAITSARRKV